MKSDRNKQQELDYQESEPFPPEAQRILDEEQKALEKNKVKQPSSVYVLLMVILLSIPVWIFCDLIVIPQWHRYINHSGPETPRQFLGTVERINFVGGERTKTQIDTETQTILARGVVSLAKGTRLEVRTNRYDKDVCVENTDDCWTLVRQ